MERSPRDKQGKARPEAKRRRLSPQVRRVELLEAALRVLRAQGPGNTRIEDVTKAAGAAKGTLYLYFASWDDLLVQIREHILSTYVVEIRRRFTAAARDDWWAAFEKECVLFVDFVDGLGELHKAIFHGPAVEQARRTGISAEEIIAEWLSRGIQAGACREVALTAAAPTRLLGAAHHRGRHRPTG